VVEDDDVALAEGQLAKLRGKAVAPS
jgi:hypothetical protein